MRRIELAPGQKFQNKMLNRIGAFNADALVAATNIVEDVRTRGDEALREYTAKFDGVEMEQFRVSQEAIDEALAKVDPKVAAAIQHAAKQIRDFHERQKQQGWFTLREDGALVGAKIEPLDSVGIYVPGGRALYPSSVLMNAIPAAVAGVKRIVCVTPPTKDGSLDSAILEACRVAGVTEIYAVGGAQAVGALAYGTESIKPVDKITGPGNAFVAAAKKLVSGDVGIDMVAGPSEVCVVADESALPELVAIDLMAQAEHDPLASCYLVTFSAEYADAVEVQRAAVLASRPYGRFRGRYHPGRPRGPVGTRPKRPSAPPAGGTGLRAAAGRKRRRCGGELACTAYAHRSPTWGASPRTTRSTCRRRSTFPRTRTPAMCPRKCSWKSARR